MSPARRGAAARPRAQNVSVEGSAPASVFASVVGREPELERLAHFLGESSAIRGLVVSGEAGIGKTTLWQAGLAIADRRGFRVLSTRASEGEAGMLFAALADLVDGIDAEVLPRIPEPQMHALDVALHRAALDEMPPDPFAVSSGFLTAVRALSAVAEPLIAIDDVQWLDKSSADSLLFLARRVKEDQARFLLSRRNDEPSALERALQPLGVEVLEVGPMSLGAISRLLSEHHGLALPRRVLHRIYEAAQGNPLFAMEIGRAVRESGIPRVGADLPMPKLIDEAFAARVAGLDPEVRRVLLVVALSPGLSRDELGGISDPLVVEDAIDSGLLVLDRSRVRAGHPMLAAASRKQSTAAERRSVHVTLARVVGDPIVSARHLARATSGHDEQAAATVAGAARLASERGAAHEAEELSAHALRLTPPGTPEEVDRVLALGRCLLWAGDMSGAAALLRTHLPDLPPGRPRALAHLMLGEASDGYLEEAELDRAISEAGDDVQLCGSALCRKAGLLTNFHAARLVEAEDIARQAFSILAGTPDDGRARVALGWTLAMRGKPCAWLSEGSVPARRGETLYEVMVERPIAVSRAFRGEVPDATVRIERLGAIADEQGDPRTRAGVCIQLCEFALRQGDIGRAERFAAEVEQWAAIDEIRVVHGRLNAVIAAVRGRPDAVRSWAGIVEDDATRPHRAAWEHLETQRALGLAALIEDEFGTAVEGFREVWEHCRREGVDDPGAFPVAGDLVEALVESGHMEQAAEVTGVLERLTAEQEHPWGQASVRRSQATIDAGAGASDQWVAGLTEAASMYGALGLDFEAARCLRYLGRAQSRAKKRGEARRNLEEAARRFDRLGASGWAANARADLSRVSGRRATDSGDLTPSEQRVAELAAGGLSNKEIARILYVSVYTVEAHLSHAYAKLGVRSRSQLAKRLNP